MATKRERRDRARSEREAAEQAAVAAERRRKLRGFVLGGLLVLVSVAAIVFVATGGSADEGVDGAESAAGAGGHIHGLGLNPKDGALFVATHNGLFRTAPEGGEAVAVGESGKDVMGFSVAGPDRFLGSGHPGQLENLPSNLGLILSTDAGRSFDPVSLLGEADFHVLRSAGTRVYGYDGSSGRLMASADGGRTWGAREPPASLIDLAIDPRNPDHVVASTDSGLFTSSDGGRTWRQLGEQIVLLAWSAPERLFLLDADGRVAVSEDGGRRFRETGKVAGEPVVLMAARSDLYVAQADGTVQRSSDGGASWRVRARV
ncbi:MAG: F510_1955 family glycosylhydrolase [Thermoleophilaceae bacterium]